MRKAGQMTVRKTHPRLQPEGPQVTFVYALYFMSVQYLKCTNVCSNESSSWNIPCNIKFYMTVSFFHSFNAWQAISGTSKWLKPSILRHSYSVLVPVFGKPAHIIFIVISHNQNWMFYITLCDFKTIHYRRLENNVIEIGNTAWNWILFNLLYYILANQFH